MTLCYLLCGIEMIDSRTNVQVLVHMEGGARQHFKSQNPKKYLQFTEIIS